MLKWMMALAVSVCLTGAVSAQDAEIEGVIGSQIEAFKADDFVSAFEFASPSIRGMFRTPENFGRMVTQGYPMVWRPAEVTFLELREVAGALWQKVQIVDGKGVVHWLDYRMQETENGWKISAVQLLDDPGLSA
ncbi:DUF4864 domain-containing protein [uncultured Tateyamaria sp.]|uniref:DUF4864 domain-containing protein n=1 Tax=uncultured Tateyamaria sp. TaxID=455651 RepID=UPI0026368632|nr:DUF4864 domain-containing protein [uncultured Tateyamaria sp.]